MSGQFHLFSSNEELVHSVRACFGPAGPAASEAAQTSCSHSLVREEGELKEAMFENCSGSDTPDFIPYFHADISNLIMNAVDRSASGQDDDNQISAKSTLESGASIDSPKYNLKEAVKLPDREDPNEWIAYNLFEFNKQISMLYGTVFDRCTQETCPEMTAGLTKYLWATSTGKPPEPKSATEYINYSLDWIQEQLDDGDIFPSESQDKDFPTNFMEICRTVAALLFRVFAHVCHHHLDSVRNNKEEAHMNTSLKHFIYFIREFDLITGEELDPLKEYMKNLT